MHRPTSLLLQSHTNIFFNGSVGINFYMFFFFFLLFFLWFWSIGFHFHPEQIICESKGNQRPRLRISTILKLCSRSPCPFLILQVVYFTLDQSNGVWQENNKINILLKFSRSVTCHRQNPALRMRLPFICSFRWQRNRTEACFRHGRLFSKASWKIKRSSKIENRFVS